MYDASINDRIVFVEVCNYLDSEFSSRSSRLIRLFSEGRLDLKKCLEQLYVYLSPEGIYRLEVALNINISLYVETLVEKKYLDVDPDFFFNVIKRNLDIFKFKTMQERDDYFKKYNYENKSKAYMKMVEILISHFILHSLFLDATYVEKYRYINEQVNISDNYEDNFFFKIQRMLKYYSSIVLNDKEIKLYIEKYWNAKNTDVFDEVMFGGIVGGAIGGPVGAVAGGILSRYFANKKKDI